MSTPHLSLVPHHRWVAAAYVDVEPNQISADDQGRFVPVTVPTGRVNPLDVFCGRCRKSWTDASGQPCSRT